ncbi:MAG: choice-of-anchor Q domain-containing protein [Solirubrobacterales bacterium]
MPLTVAAAVLVSTLAATGASAKTFRVSRHDDPPPGKCKHHQCSLREAIRAANRHRGRDVVVLPDRAPRYELSRRDGRVGQNGVGRGDLDVTGPITIRHGLGGRAVIDAGGLGRVLDIHHGAPTKLARITLTGGDAALDASPAQHGAGHSASAAGGGVATRAPLRMIRSAVVANRADAGGGIFAAAPLTLMRTRVRENEADTGLGGGIYTRHGSVLIIRSQVTANRAGDAGGGVVVRADAFRISKATVAGNVARTDAGGVYVLGAKGRIAESTIDHNAAHRSGGGVFQSGSRLAVFNSTVTRNRADQTGGGIQSSAVGGHVMLNSVTVVRNVDDLLGHRALGGGLASRGGSFSVVNSIVALNQSDTTPNDCHGAFDSFGGNLLSTMDGCKGFAGPAMVGPNPRLGSLKDNGGPTKTMALRRDSPAIGNANDQREPLADQRGRSRSLDPDIGAFERLP